MKGFPTNYTATSLFGFYCYPKPWFSSVRVFHDEEHSTEYSVLEISSSGNVVHAFMEDFELVQMWPGSRGGVCSIGVVILITDGRLRGV